MRGPGGNKWADPAPFEIKRPRLPSWFYLPGWWKFAALPVLLALVAVWLLVRAGRLAVRYPLAVSAPLVGLLVKRAAPKLVEQVDPRVVANPRQVRELLTGVTYVGSRNRDRGAHLTAFFVTLYYSAARPAEALALRQEDCKLPETGWGELRSARRVAAGGREAVDGFGGSTRPTRPQAPGRE